MCVRTSRRSCYDVFCVPQGRPRASGENRESSTRRGGDAQNGVKCIVAEFHHHPRLHCEIAVCVQRQRFSSHREPANLSCNETRRPSLNFLQCKGLKETRKETNTSSHRIFSKLLGSHKTDATMDPYELRKADKRAFVRSCELTLRRAESIAVTTSRQDYGCPTTRPHAAERCRFYSTT